MDRRVALLSDLHLERWGYRVPDIQADLVVLAGDILESGVGSPVAWAKANLPAGIPVVFIPGNHDFFGCRFGRALARWREEARHSHVRVLYNETAHVGGIRVLGTPLWSGLSLWRSPIHEAGLKRLLPQRIEDFSQIYQDDGKTWTVARMLAEHAKALAFLEQGLADDSVPTLVATHWPPHARSTSPAHDGDFLNPYFINHLPGLVERAGAWMHGHVHGACDYRVGQRSDRGRVVCNPRGTPRQDAEPVDYQPLIIDFPA